MCVWFGVLLGICLKIVLEPETVSLEFGLNSVVYYH